MENTVNIRETSTTTAQPVMPKKKIPLQLVLGAVALLLLVLGFGVAFFLSQQSQDIRQQAFDDLYGGVVCLQDECNDNYELREQ